VQSLQVVDNTSC